MFSGHGLFVPVQPEIIRAARNMIDNHGARAAAVAKQRGDSLLACGRYDTAATWEQIAAAIGEIQRRAASASRRTQREGAAEPAGPEAGTLPLPPMYASIGE